ncbi:MAG: hypothetical protein KGY67_00680 [Candidatus Thermoplasmatota archaeon]|nr:hypothetical protein [Candidatus Thermoplasmatota archaeon]
MKTLKARLVSITDKDHIDPKKCTKKYVYEILNEGLKKEMKITIDTKEAVELADFPLHKNDTVELNIGIKNLQSSIGNN